MQIITLYRYEREPNKIDVSPNKPDSEYTTLFRLIADEKKVLTKNGIDICTVIDVDNTEEWYEIEAPQEDKHVLLK